MSFLTKEQIKDIGFKEIGENVLISDKAMIYNPERIKIGSHVRIDDFCLLSAGVAGIQIGNFVHIGAYTSIVGAAEVVIEDFVGVSFKVSIFSSSDDYMGYAMTNPMVPEKYRNVKSIRVVLCKHALIGAHAVLLPGTHLEPGVSIGAMAVVSSKLEGWFVYMGSPAKKLVRRSKKLLEKELELRKEFPNIKFMD